MYHAKCELFNSPLHLLQLNFSKEFVKGGLNFRLIGFISEYTERVKHIVFYPVGCGIKIIPIVIPDVVCSVDGHNQHDNAGASRYSVLLVCGIPGVDAPYRLICVGVLWIITTIYIIHYIKKVQSDPTRSVVYGDEEVVKQAEDVALPEVTLRRILVLVIFFAAFVAIFYTVVKGVCTIMVLCGIFLIAGILAGAVYGYTPNEIAKYFVEGCTDMAFGALLIGMAASIGVVLTKGNIIYTCVHALCSLLNNMPVALAGVFMNIINIFVNFFIISGSGQAATVMPILGPTASVLGMTQQTAILAYQLGDGFTNMIYPHSGTLMAALAIGRIPWQKWAKWAWKFILIETVAGWVFIAVAALMNWGAMFG